MKVLIVGASHSGTTAMAELLQGLGWEFGSDIRWVRPGHGMEHGPLVDYFTPLDRSFIGGQFRWAWWRTTPLEAEDVRRLNHGLPPAVKANWFLRWLPQWLAAGGARPEHIILCVRPIEGIQGSFQRIFGNPQVTELDVHASYGVLAQTAAQYEIPITVMAFPRFVDDPDYALRQLPECLQRIDDPDAFYAAHDATMDRQKVHVR